MIHLVVPWLPPSSNHAYATIRGTNKRVLTAEGKSFKVRTTAHLAQNYPTEMMFFKPNTPYFLLMRFFFEKTLNSGWPTKAESRYKRLDVGNRLKLFEDAMKDAAGIDDSQHMSLLLQKYEDANERVEVWAWNLEAEKSPFDLALKDL